MTDWTPVVVVLLVGLCLGGLLFLLFRKKEAAPPQDVDLLRDLRAKRDNLIGQLRDLEMGDRRTDAEIGKERFRLELEAAEVLRVLHREELRPLATQPAPSVAPRSSAGKGFAWGLGTAAFFALLIGLLLQFSKDRGDGAPVTGGVPGIEFGERRQDDPELDALTRAVAAKPDDLEARLDLAQAFLFRNRLLDAWEILQGAGSDHPRALTYEAVVREAMGQLDKARELLDRAVEKDPSLSEAWVRRGIVAFEQGDYGVAIRSWETALSQRPDGRSALEPVIAEAKRRLDGGPAIAGATEPQPSTRSAGAAEAKPPAASSAIRITVDIADEARARATEGSILFVTARPAGSAGGPPVAAKRIPASRFPVELTLGQEDSMMGQPFPASATVEARLDRDGNAMTREADDPAARAEGLGAGAEVRLVLR